MIQTVGWGVFNLYSEDFMLEGGDWLEMGISDDTLRTTSGAQEASLGLQDLGSALRDRVEIVAGGRKVKVTPDRGD